MFRPRRAPTTDARRGIILLVVLALLTLFAIVGISFVLYANAEADASRVYREAQGFVDLRPDIPADQLLNWALGQAVYDVEDRPNSSNAHLYSAMRGHSLARDMYGWDSDNTQSNIYPFNGTGRFHATGISFATADEYNLINYTYYNGDGFLRDPERYGNRTGANPQNSPLQPYTGGWNSPYTFPDLNHCYLAAVDSNGNILTPSFARGWVSPPNGFGPMDPTNPNWNVPSATNPMLKYMVLRPRPADMAAGFPFPASPNGDVQNAVGITTGPDSFWMDLDYPVQTAPDGTKFKPLFAFLIMDLDNRINLNMAGNVRGSGNAHLSNRGYGPWEMNPRQLPNAGGMSANEWPQLYLGNATANPQAAGRYGGPIPAAQPQPVPGGPPPGTNAPTGLLPHVYAQTDTDGCNGYAYPNNTGAATVQYALPSGTNCFPTFPAGYDNGSANNEPLNHPSLYNLFAPVSPNRRFPLSDMQNLLNNGTGGTLWKSSSFGQLCPTLFGSARLRSLVTTDSYDVNRPGVMPWLWDRTASAYAVSSAPYGPPSGAPVAMPALTSRSGAVPANSEFRIPGQSGNTVDWRWNAVDNLGNALTKIDLNRFLPPYPHMGKWTQWPAQPSLTNPSGYVFYNGNPNSAEVPVGTPYTGNANAVTQYGVAEQARKNLANDIYRCFLAVTGVPPVTAPDPGTPTDADLAPRRWLAQLAVNIVDYIDEDDISTPFNFYTQADAQNSMSYSLMATSPNPTGANELLKYWVYGTELPRVVLNEVYAEYQQPTMAGMPRTGMAGPFGVRVWAELHNPLPGGATPAGAQPQDANAVPLYFGTVGSGYAPYQVVLASTNNAGPSHGLLMPAAGQNVLGTPDTASAPGNGIRNQTADTDFGIASTPTFGGGGPTSGPPSLQPQDALVLGPTGPPDYPDPRSSYGPDVEGTINANVAATPNGQVPAGKQYVTTPHMEYQVNVGYAGGAYTAWTDPANGTPKDDRYTAPNGGLTVLLRRAANPYLRPQTDPTMGNYNPFITVDYMEHVSLNDYTPLPAPYSPPFPTVGVTIPARPARGKLQPYAADFNEVANETYPPSPPAPAAQPTPTLHSLGLVPNGPAPAGGKYDWLVHLDRQLISPGELLHVSGFAPFLLTHQFITGPTATPVKFTHRAPWFDEANLGVPAGQSSRLYRALELLDVHSRAAGVGFSGRVPGRVNINTIWDQETLNALCDPQGGNYFGAADVSTVWAAIQASRQNPGASASPFMGMAVGNSPGGGSDPWFTSPSGIGNTLLRNGPGGTPLFQVTNASATHPYQQDELLTKILDNVTTRSNVFAVWVTVGFFPVVQDTDAMGNAIRPVKLGAEIGLSTSTNIRHRLFAIVDRSTLAIDQQVTTLSAAVNASPYPQNLPVAATSGTTSNTNITWSIGAGTVLLVGTGSSKEGVLVTNNGGQLQGVFQLSHASGTAVTVPGNPGPQTGFSVHDPRYADVVPYFAIMQ